ncbi:MAG TPA: hypothetical protein VHU80_16430 [Polyangiaceae bacterium]|nr:hypothetical protein [Polyangiaceae bacterium]
MPPAPPGEEPPNAGVGAPPADCPPDGVPPLLAGEPVPVGPSPDEPALPLPPWVSPPEALASGDFGVAPVDENLSPHPARTAQKTAPRSTLLRPTAIMADPDSRSGVRSSSSELNR